MRVAFAKSDDGRRCSWRAQPRKGRAFQGSTMASRGAGTALPHDLATFVVEAGLGLEHGFWNLVANGATFRSIGRRRTEPGRRLIAAHREALDAAERAVNAQVDAWRRGWPTPLGPALDAMLRRWLALAPGEELPLEWPTRRLAAASPRRRAARGRRGGGGIRTHGARQGPATFKVAAFGRSATPPRAV